MYSNRRQSKQRADSGLSVPFDDEDFGMPSRRRASQSSSRNILSRLRRKGDYSGGFPGGGDSDEDEGPSNTDFGGPDLSYNDISGLRDRARYPAPVHGGRPQSLTSGMISQDTTPIIPTMAPGSGPNRGASKPQDKYRHKMVESRRQLLSSESGVYPPMPPSVGVHSAPPRAMSMTSGPPRTMSMQSMQSMPPAFGNPMPPNGPMYFQGADGRMYPTAPGNPMPRPMSVRPPPAVGPPAMNMPYGNGSTPQLHPPQGYYPPSPQRPPQRTSYQQQLYPQAPRGPSSPWPNMRSDSRPQSPAPLPMPYSPQPQNARSHDSFDFDVPNHNMTSEPSGDGSGPLSRPDPEELAKLRHEILILSIELGESARRELGLNPHNELAQHASALATAERNLGLERAKRAAIEGQSRAAYDIGRYADLEYRYSEATQLLDLRSQQYEILKSKYELQQSELIDLQKGDRELKERLRENQVQAQMSSVKRGSSEHIKAIERENSRLRKQLDELSDRGSQGERVRTLEEQRSVLREALRTMHERKDHEIRALELRIAHLESIKGRTVSKSAGSVTGEFTKGAETPGDQMPLSLPRLRPQSRPTSPLHLNFDLGKGAAPQDGGSPRSSLALG